MPLATHITLPRSAKATFPDMCIVCHAKPDSITKIAENSQNPFATFFFPILFLFGWSRVEVPICQSCKFRFRLQRWGRNIVCWTLTFVLVWWLMPYTKGLPKIVRMIVGGGLVLLCLSPYLFVEVFWPRIFDATVREDTIDYAFASPIYAAAFDALNSPDRREETHGT